MPYCFWPILTKKSKGSLKELGTLAVMNNITLTLNLSLPDQLKPVMQCH